MTVKPPAIPVASQLTFRHEPEYCSTYPPSRGPNTGPKNGAIAAVVNGTAISFGKKRADTEAGINVCAADAK